MKTELIREKGILAKKGVRLALVYGCLALWVAAGYLMNVIFVAYDMRWVFVVGAVLFAGVSFILPDGKKETWKNPTRRSSLKVMAFFLFAILNSSLMGKQVPDFIRVHVEVHTWLLLTPVLLAVGFYYVMHFVCRKVNPKILLTGDEDIVEVEAILMSEQEKIGEKAGKSTETEVVGPEKNKI